MKSRTLSYSSQFLSMLRRATSEERYATLMKHLGEYGLTSYHPNDRINLEQLTDIFANAARNDPDIAMKTGCAIDIGQFGSASYYLVSCSTVFEVFRFFTRFYSLMVSHEEVMQIDLTPTTLQVDMTITQTGRSGDYLRYELLVFSVLTMIRQSVSRDCYPEYIEMPLANTTDRNRLAKNLGIDVVHNPEKIVWRYGRRWFGFRLPGENPAMRQFLRGEVENYLHQLRRQHSIVEKIHIFLEAQSNFAGVTQVTVADAFNLSESTFKRRLQDEDTNFKSILQTFKQTRSLLLLNRPDQDYEEIAHTLGFAERASFERAFKTWYGMTPAQFREIAERCQISAPIDSLLDQENLPASPGVCQQIIDITSDDNFELDDLINALQSDPVLTGKIIGLSNSAMYGGVAKVTSLQQALIKLGVQEVKNMAMGILANDAAGGSAALPIDMRKYWISALTTAHWAGELSQLSQSLKNDRETLFLTGLLHNIGFILLARLRPDVAETIMPDLEASPTLSAMTELERQQFGVSRYSASAILLAHWGLPVDLISHLHGLIQITEGQTIKRRGSLLIFKVIRHLTALSQSLVDEATTQQFISELSELLECDESKISETLKQLRNNQDAMNALSASLVP